MEEEIPATGDISILLISGLLIISIIGIIYTLKRKQKI
ncbi:MAG: LPXTG cell wall anchor domain-containing protein [Clostridia bacterium]